MIFIMTILTAYLYDSNMGGQSMTYERYKYAYHILVQIYMNYFHTKNHLIFIVVKLEFGFFSRFYV
jgi:hypothetical protein